MPAPKTLNKITQRFLKKSRNLESDESSPYYNGLDEYFFKALL